MEHDQTLFRRVAPGCEPSGVPGFPRARRIGQRGELVVFATATGERIATIDVRLEPRVVGFHPAGKHVRCVGDDDALRIFDLATGKLAREVPFPGSSLRCLRPAGTGRLLSVGSHAELREVETLP